MDISYDNPQSKPLAVQAAEIIGVPSNTVQVETDAESRVVRVTLVRYDPITKQHTYAGDVPADKQAAIMEWATKLANKGQ